MATLREDRRRPRPRWATNARARTVGIGLGSVLAVLPCLAFGVRPASADGYGVSPAIITMDHALRGHVYERSIQVFGLSTGSGTAVFRLSVSGRAGGWMRLFDPRNPTSGPMDQVSAPGDGVNSYVGLKITVPATAANGAYAGVVTLTGTGTGTGSDGVDVSAQVPISVVVTGSQVLAGEILGVSALAKAEAGYPAQVSVLVRNTGNVDLSPSVSVRLAGPDGQTVDQLSAPPGTVRPGDSAGFGVSWDTSGRRPGTYLAEATVSVGGRLIGRQDTSIHLEAPAEDPRAGRLVSLRLASPPVPQELDEVVARFANTGSLGVAAQFQGRFECDGREVGPISSPEALVAGGQSNLMLASVTLPTRGRCRVTGAVVFAGASTASRHLDFRVGGSDGEAEFTTVAAAATAAAVAAGAWMIILSRRRRRRTPGRSA